MSRNKASGSSGVQKASQDKGKAAASLKRKADPTPATSSGFTRTKLENALLTLSPEAKRLLQIVNKSEETALRVAISKAILTATPSDLVVYNKLLGSLVTTSTPTSTSQTPLHCVRCHTSYLQHENNSRACKIPHEEPECLGEDASDDYPVSDPGYDPRSGRELMKYPCCGQRMLEDELDYGEEMCVEDMHTTDPRRVKYFIDPNAGPKKKKKKVDHRPDYYSRYMNKNPHVITCKEKGCPGA